MEKGYLDGFAYYCILFLMVFFLSTCTNIIRYVKCVNARHMFNVNYIM